MWNESDAANRLVQKSSVAMSAIVFDICTFRVMNRIEVGSGAAPSGVVNPPLTSASALITVSVPAALASIQAESA